MGIPFAILAYVHLSAIRAGGGSATVHLRHASGLLRRAVNEISRLQPERVIILGDLVNSGADDEYELARQILEPLADQIEPMVGNHELLAGTTVDFERHWHVNAARRLFIAGVNSVLLNSGIDGLPPTQWQGRLAPDQLELVRAASSDAPRQPLAVFCHHPLKGTIRNSDEPMIGLDNSDELLDVLNAHDGSVMMISGHRHHQSVAQLPREGKTPITCVGCGALFQWPHGFLIVDAFADRWELKMQSIVDDPTQSPDPNAANDEYRALNEGDPADQEFVIRF